MQEEQDLVRRARQGDKEAFAALYESHYGRIYRYVVVKIGRRVEAEDMTQQVFVKAYKSIASYQMQGAPFSAWLFRIAHNQIVDYIRRVSKRPTILLDESLPIPGTSDPQGEVELKLNFEQVVEATRQLTKAQREVVSLRFAGEMSISEVAATMGKSEGAIKALQHSAIRALRKTLKAGEHNGKI
ncbi:MAG: sigma-70 family RNA polymerase sigma factor [Dehalococcoidia bacterium]|nr:sigma-70 family RNA polymerase sigma factor [Dehalococcoidia bacterium]